MSYSLRYYVMLFYYVMAYLHGAEIVCCQPGALLFDIWPFPFEQMYNYISARTTIVIAVILAGHRGDQY